MGLTANQKVDTILMGLRRVRSKATSLRKEGIVLNGTAKAKILEEATLIGAMFEIFGLAPSSTSPGTAEVELMTKVYQMTMTPSTSPLRCHPRRALHWFSDLDLGIMLLWS